MRKKLGYSTQLLIFTNILPDLAKLVVDSETPALQFLTWVDSRESPMEPFIEYNTRPLHFKPANMDDSKKYIIISRWDGKDIRDHEILEVIYV